MSIKLTKEDVLTIHGSLLAKSFLAERYKVNVKTIFEIKRGISHKKITGGIDNFVYEKQGYKSRYRFKNLRPNHKYVVYDKKKVVDEPEPDLTGFSSIENPKPIHPDGELYRGFEIAKVQYFGTVVGSSYYTIYKDQERLTQMSIASPQAAKNIIDTHIRNFQQPIYK